MELKERITAYIIKTAPVTMDTIIEVATAKGFTQSEVLTALDKVHRDKRISYTANASGVVTYKLANAKKDPTDHLKWLNGSNDQGKPNYPPMDSTNDGSGIDIDISHLFMTREEAKEYRAAASGRPAYMIQSKYGKKQKT